MRKRRCERRSDDGDGEGEGEGEATKLKLRRHTRQCRIASVPSLALFSPCGVLPAFTLQMTGGVSRISLLSLTETRRGGLVYRGGWAMYVGLAGWVGKGWAWNRNAMQNAETRKWVFAICGQLSTFKALAQTMRMTTLAIHASRFTPPASNIWNTRVACSITPKSELPELQPGLTQSNKPSKFTTESLKMEEH